MIQAQLSEALGCEPPSVTLMTRRLEASGHIPRKPAPSDKRAQTVAELPHVLNTLTGNVDTRRPYHPSGRRDAG